MERMPAPLGTSFALRANNCPGGLPATLGTSFAFRANNCPGGLPATLRTSFALRANNCPSGLPATLGTSFALRANDRWQSCGLLGCVIMASGLGKRFGGNKLLAELGGKPLIGWVLDATEGIFARRVVVTRHPEVEALCRERQVPAVLHDLPDRSDTVRLGLEAVGEEVSGCMFCPGDQPLLSRETVRTMAEQAVQDRWHIWRLSWEDVAGSPVIFPKRFFPELRALPQGKGGNALVQKNPGLVRFVPARDRCELWDVDRPEDLEKLSAYLER